MLSVEGIRDYRLAKRKAAQRLGVAEDRALPSNAEVDEALREHQRLFRSEQQPLELRRRREAAVEAMRFLKRFEPRLVGAVLDGSADQHSAVCLHLYADTPEDVADFLAEHGIAFAQSCRRLRLDRERSREVAVLKLIAGGLDVDLTILPARLRHQPPLGPLDDKPMQRASLREVEALLGR